MTDITDIKTAIKSVLDSQATQLQACYKYNESRLSGFPAAIITFEGNDAEYNSTTHDKKRFLFKITTYYAVKQESEQAEAERVIDLVTDELLTIFSNRDVLGLSNGWVEPVASKPDFATADKDIYWYSEVTIKFIKYTNHT